MDNREMLIELIAQTLAPRLYKLYGQRPEDMGFPFADSKEEYEERIEVLVQSNETSR